MIMNKPATATRTIEGWRTKTFKTTIEVTQAEYDRIIAAGQDQDYQLWGEIHDRNDWDDSAVKLKRVSIDISDETGRDIADDIELL